jgi:fumarylacetoacetate (FAA) hydrolase
VRLASLRQGGRDGMLILVDRSGRQGAGATRVAPTLQAALDDWEHAAPELKSRQRQLDGNDLAEAFPLALDQLAAPLPRAFQWADGSAYLSHVERVRRARGAEMPSNLLSDPLMYQGGSDGFLAPTDPIPLLDENWGLDFEAEVAVITDDVPMGVTPDNARAYIRLVLLVNDVSLRNLIPAELAKGFGFFQSKPATAFSPFAATPDELGAAWRGGRVHLRLRVTYRGELVGDLDAGPEMHFGFFELLQHVTRTRAFTAGTILGSGTVSNADRARGISCLAERRMREIIELGGKPATPFMRSGDRVAIEMLDGDGRSLFGRIDQVVNGRPP